MTDFGFGTLTFQVKDLLSDLESRNVGTTPIAVIYSLYLIKSGEFPKRQQGVSILTTLYFLSELKILILCSFNHFILQISVHIVEIIAVTGHAHQQIAVIFGASLRCQQSGCVNHIKLNVVTSQ